MYTLNKCRFPGCDKCAISVSDSNVKLTGQEGFCIDHCPDKIQAINTLKEYIYTHDKIVGMTACGLVVEDLNLNGKNFTAATSSTALLQISMHRDSEPECVCLIFLHLPTAII